MTFKLRNAAIHLALIAMMLRALLPAGWMPNPAVTGESFLVVCTMDGPVQQADQHQQGKKHTQDDGQHSHEECPFAAAPHVAAPATVAQLALPSYFGRFSSPPSLTTSAIQFSTYQPQSPRAPPLSA